jgi:hypothetical protein
MILYIFSFIVERELATAMSCELYQKSAGFKITPGHEQSGEV